MYFVSVLHLHVVIFNNQTAVCFICVGTGMAGGSITPSIKSRGLQFVSAPQDLGNSAT